MTLPFWKKKQLQSMENVYDTQKIMQATKLCVKHCLKPIKNSSA